MSTATDVSNTHIVNKDIHVSAMSCLRPAVHVFFLVLSLLTVFTCQLSSSSSSSLAAAAAAADQDSVMDSTQG